MRATSDPASSKLPQLASLQPLSPSLRLSTSISLASSFMAAHFLNLNTFILKRKFIFTHIHTLNVKILSLARKE